MSFKREKSESLYKKKSEYRSRDGLKDECEKSEATYRFALAKASAAETTMITKKKKTATIQEKKKKEIHGKTN